jgi:hypothetical protein
MMEFPSSRILSRVRFAMVWPHGWEGTISLPFICWIVRFWIRRTGSQSNDHKAAQAECILG